ncbi:MAG TPA: DinB family protein [Ferruginibacter sp.]|nr:DinB family protein [Ferruginibacter sp.]
MPKPSPSSYPAYFKRYIDQVAEDDLMTAFENQLPQISKFLATISEEKSAYAYDTGKWTLKEVLQHIIDAERIFNYRSLCFARRETASLPGFDENEYAVHCDANRRPWQELVDEFIAVRKGTELMYKSFTDEMLQFSGVSNNNPATALCFGFVTLGHFNHHKKVVEERYL